MLCYVVGDEAREATQRLKRLGHIVFEWNSRRPLADHLFAISKVDYVVVAGHMNQVDGVDVGVALAAGVRCLLLRASLGEYEKHALVQVCDTTEDLLAEVGVEHDAPQSVLDSAFIHAVSRGDSADGTQT